MHLVLDLDETLIHITLKPIDDPDFTFRLDGDTYYGKKRPGLDTFLRYIFSKYESVSVWTAATKNYADKVLSKIMTTEQIRRLKFLKTRRDLTRIPGQPYMKQLQRVFNDPSYGISAENTIMIDDRADVLRNNPGNGLLIPPFKGSSRDQYLLKLIIILDGILHHNLGFGHFPRVLDLRALTDK